MNTIETLSLDKSSSRIDLEMAILAHILINFQEKNIEKKLKLEICVNRLNSCKFSLTYHIDIFNFIFQALSESGELPSPWQVAKYMESRFKSKGSPEAARKCVADILNFNDFFLVLHDIETLVGYLENETQKERVNKELSKVLESGDVEKIRELLDEPTIKDDSKLERKITQYQSAPSTFEKAIIKRDMRQSLGLMPNEIQDVLDNLLQANREVPQIQSLEDFLAQDFGDSNWLYPGLIPANCVTMIPGAPGTGKTMFMLELIFSYLLDLPFLGEFPSVLANKKNRALIVNSDQPPKDAQEMLKKNAKALKCRGSKRVDIIHRWTLQDLPLLETSLKENLYQIVGIDSYTGIHKHDPKYDENKTNAAYAMDEFQRLASKYNCTFVVVQHGLKSEARGVNKARGNQMIAGTASCVINLDQAQPDKNGNCDPTIKFLEIAKIRNAPLGKRVIKFNPSTYSYDLLPDTIGQQINTVNRLANTLLNTCFFRNPTHLFTESDLIKNVEGIGRREMLHTALTKLEQRGLIQIEHDDNMDAHYQYRVPNQTAIEVLQDIGF